MSFNSLQFLLFLPTVICIYFALPARWRWFWLLISSYFFYMQWKPAYIVLILLSTVVDYIIGRLLQYESRLSIRRLYLALSITINLGLLFVFKYFNFFNDALRSFCTSLHLEYPVNDLQLLLPVGISFYTFQTLSYTIDVYRNKTKTEKHIGLFTLFVAFFPQLVAGPIERSQNLLPQLKERKQFDYARAVSGFRRILWGFFKKVVIADRLASMVNLVYNNPTEYSGLPLLIATYAFAFQIYCDFSAYSDIAIGAARIMGYNLMENFKQPYYAKSISEFWQRWHISLSTWFRDYLYIPLGGSRVKSSRWCINILIVFLLSGLWHGANWTFLVWGGLHGLYYIAGKMMRKFMPSHIQLRTVPNGFLQALKIFFTFHLVCLGWIFFRANNLGDALYIVQNTFTNLQINLEELNLINGYDLFIVFVAIALMEIVHLIQLFKGSITKIINNQSSILRWTTYYILLFAILMLGKFGVVEFIYFQF